jgi:hypothetical protein
MGFTIQMGLVVDVVGVGLFLFQSHCLVDFDLDVI